MFSGSLDGTLRLWDPATLACLRVYSCSGCGASSAADASADAASGNAPPMAAHCGAMQSSSVAAAGGTQSSSTAGQPQAAAQGLSEPASATFFEAWNVLVSGHDRGEVAVWNVSTGGCTVLRGHSNTVACMEMAFLAVRRRHQTSAIVRCIAPGASILDDDNTAHALRCALDTPEIALFTHCKACFTGDVPCRRMWNTW